MRTANPHPETRERLYDSAQRLMLEKGYPATTVDEICSNAGVTKGSFFHYFQSKDHLGRELLERYLTRRVAEQAVLLHNEPDPLRRLYAHLDDVIQTADDEQHRDGCIMGMFAHELARTNPEIGRLCAEAFRRWMEHVEKTLEDVKRTYAPQSAVDARSLSEHFIAIIEGSLILSRVSPDPTIVQQNLRHFRSYLEMIFGQPRQPIESER